MTISDNKLHLHSRNLYIDLFPWWILTVHVWLKLDKPGKDKWLTAVRSKQGGITIPSRLPFQQRPFLTNTIDGLYIYASKVGLISVSVASIFESSVYDPSLKNKMERDLPFKDLQISVTFFGKIAFLGCKSMLLFDGNLQTVMRFSAKTIWHAVLS